jgi:hypothetical protein
MQVKREHVGLRDMATNVGQARDLRNNSTLRSPALGGVASHWDGPTRDISDLDHKTSPLSPLALSIGGDPSRRYSNPCIASYRRGL